MTTDLLHGAPDWRVPAREQFRLIAATRRWEMLGLAALALLILLTWTLGALKFHAGSAEPVAVEAAASGVGFILLVALAWPISVWYPETPSRRRYHWSLPVGRTAHDLWRVAAGAAWLLLGIGAFALGLTVAASIAGRASDLAQLSPWFLANCVTAPLTFYAFASVAGLVSEHPGRWILGVPIGCFLLTEAVARTIPGSVVHRSLLAVFTGRYGFLTATGRWLQPTGGPGAAGEAAAGSAWLAAALLWLAIGVAAVVLSASRHRGR